MQLEIKGLKKFHIRHNKIATLTAVRPPARFGELQLKNSKVINFNEKPQVQSGWINGGFFVLNYEIFKYIKNDLTVFEKEPLEKITKIDQLQAYKHKGFWQCMDTKRDYLYLNSLSSRGNILWKN